MYQGIAVTERINRLRDIYRKCPMQTERIPSFYSMARFQSIYFLEGWVKYKKEPTTVLRRARAEAEILLRAEPIIEEDELIVGQMELTAAEEDKDKFAALDEEFQKMSSYIERTSRKDHLCVDYEKLLAVGVKGLIDEIKAEKDKLSFSEPDKIAENVEKNEFYDGCLIELEALLIYANKYADKAMLLAEQEQNEKRKEELLEIAKVMRNVPLNPPATFREAVQSVHFYTFTMFGLYPLGRADQYLLEFYNRDLEKGILTKECAQELIDNLCLLVSTYIDSRLASSIMLGGRDKNGKAVENDLTYMFLTSIDHIKMADPGTSLSITDETSDELLDYAVSIIAKGNTHPAIYNDRAISEALVKIGISENDKYSYINTTCTEISICGKSSMWTTCPFHVTPKALLQVLNTRSDLNSIEDIYVEFEKELRKEVIKANNRFNIWYLEKKRNGAEPLRVSCLVDDCIKKGASIAQGGAVYNYIYPSFVGTSNVVDSIAAIEKLVFEEQRFSLAEFMDIVNNNFDGNEPLRQYIINKLPHYGNNEDFTDEIMSRISQIMQNVCKGIYNYYGKELVPSMFCFSNAAHYGKSLAATPDGRLAGKPIADSVGASQGRDTEGPTAAILSATSWDQSPYMGGICTNMKFNKSSLSDKKIPILREMLKVFIERNGVQMQINVVDAEILKKAMEHSEDYNNLIVRVGGYSDFFVKLNKEMQLEIISRTEHEV